MYKRIEYKSGDLFGEIVFLEELPHIREPSGNKRRVANFKCTCGNIFKAHISNVKSGHTSSCGCLSIEKALKSKGYDGRTKTRLYKIYKSIINRCYRENSTKYYLYGALGVTVCNEWRQSFDSFKDWAYSSGFTEENTNLSIDRIEVHLGYSPENCRFVDTYVQAQNKRLLTKNNSTGYRGVTKTPSNTYQAKINSNGVKYYLGTFKTALEAAEAYDNFVIENKTYHPKNLK